MSKLNRSLDLNINSIGEGIFAVDRNMVIKSLNTAAQKLTGWQEQEIIGCSCKDIFQSPNCNEACPLKEAMERNIADHKKIWLKNKAGKLIPVITSAMTLKDQNDKTIGGLVIFYNQVRVKPSSFGKFNEMGLVGSSNSMLEVFQLIETVASAECPVIIKGPTGTGKNVVAKIIHELSRRKDGPFIEVNCVSLSDNLLESELFGHERGAFTGAVNRRKGRFETASGGTIFLDEIGEICTAFQAKLLRVVEQGELERVGSSETIKVDIRLIAATNKELKKMVEQGLFREDLYYRLNVFVIDLPPLAARKDDIKPLAEYFISEFNKVYEIPRAGISDRAMDLLHQYDYPGNVRELRNIIEHAYIKSTGHVITTKDLPVCLQFVSNEIKLPAIGREKEEEVYRIKKAIEHCNGNKTQAAKLLGISRKTLYNRLNKYGMP